MELFDIIEADNPIDTGSETVEYIAMDRNKGSGRSNKDNSEKLSGRAEYLRATQPDKFNYLYAAENLVLPETEPTREGVQVEAVEYNAATTYEEIEEIQAENPTQSEAVIDQEWGRLHSLRSRLGKECNQPSTLGGKILSKIPFLGRVRHDYYDSITQPIKDKMSGLNSQNIEISDEGYTPDFSRFKTIMGSVKNVLTGQSSTSVKRQNPDRHKYSKRALRKEREARLEMKLQN